MKNFFPILLLATAPALLFSQKDDKKWNVSDPQKSGGVPYHDVEFTATEGTWMNIDVSPDGKTIAFDLLGDIYTMSIDGGAAKCLRNGLAWEVQPRFSPDGTKISFTSDAGGGDNIWYMNADGTGGKQITKENFRLLNNAVWVDNQYVIARKHYTSTRSLGAGEMWMYHLNGGEGIQLTKRKNDQQDVNEPTVSRDGRYLYFSEDLYPGGNFQYNKDPNNQIFAVRRYDLKTGELEDVTGGSGGACRPQISPDGNWLAFVRRDRVKSVLCVRNLETAEEFPIFDGLDKDQQEAWTIFGCYPGFAWMPDGKEILFWAGGKIKRLTLGQPIGLGKNTVAEIPFSCAVKTKVAETLKFENKVFEQEFTAHAIRQATTSPDGKTLIFNAAGQLYSKVLPNDAPKLLLKNAWRMSEGKKVDDLTALANAFEPSFSRDGKWLVFSVWDDERLGKISLLNLETNEVRDLTAAKGIYRNPSFSPDGKRIVFQKQDGDDELGFAFCQKAGVYTVNADGSDMKFLEKIGGSNPRFSADGQRIFVNTGGGLDKSMKSFDLNGFDERVHFKTKYANQWTVSPDGKWLAFSELHKAYICAFPETGKTLDLSADMKTFPCAQIARDAGYSLHWSGDSKKLHWTLGDEYFTDDFSDRFSFVPGAPDSLPGLDTAGLKIGLKLPSDVPTGTTVFENARIVTMEGDKVIENGYLAVRDNKIVLVGAMSEFEGKDFDKAHVVDCQGKTIIPGFVDVHSHSGNFRSGHNPQKQWEYYANLAYGVTTMHDPSTNSEMAFSNSEMLKAGRMVGPRLFSTGTILYGADGDFKAPINSLDDARSTLRRTKAWGAFSVKSYNQPRREQRQQVIEAARELNMLVVPEGGSFFYHNLSQVVDGHTGIEHNIPVAPVYQDVIALWGKTKAHNTPTLIVNYGSVNGEYYWYQNTDVWANKRLLNFIPRHIVEERSRHITKVPDDEYQNGYILTSKSCKRMQDAGININLGSHGQLQGLGAHWELWMLQQGGMSNMQALRCATLNGAKYLGMDKEIGSLTVGKLADLQVLDANPLDDIRNSNTIRYVMVNGRLFDAETMNEIGNHEQKRGKFWFEQPGSQTNGSMQGTHTCQEGRCVCGH